MIVFSILLFVTVNFFFPQREFKGKKIRTVATLNGTRWVNNRLGEYSYYVGNHTIKHNGDFTNTQVIGDKYNAYYDSEDSSTIEILYSQPVFLDEEVILSTEAEIVYAHPWHTPNTVKFRYNVNGEEYIRFQDTEENFKNKYPNVKEGQKYLIKYWMKNPQRSIMYFDQPIDESK